jgi:hypothetical protein
VVVDSRARELMFKLVDPGTRDLMLQLVVDPGAIELCIVVDPEARELILQLVGMDPGARKLVLT